MKDRIIEIVELGQPQSLIQRENDPITELIKTDLLIEELNEQLRLYNVVGQSVSTNDAKPVLSDVPCSLHFVVINIAALQATGHIDRQVVTIKLTAEQQNELRQKLHNRVDDFSFFDVMMSFD